MENEKNINLQDIEEDLFDLYGLKNEDLKTNQNFLVAEYLLKRFNEEHRGEIIFLKIRRIIFYFLFLICFLGLFALGVYFYFSKIS